jgi:hypothetical protein
MRITEPANRAYLSGSRTTRLVDELDHVDRSTLPCFSSAVIAIAQSLE